MHCTLKTDYQAKKLNIFLHFKVTLPSKKQAIQFLFSSYNFLQQKRTSNFPLIDEKLCLNVWRHKQA